MTEHCLNLQLYLRVKFQLHATMPAAYVLFVATSMMSSEIGLAVFGDSLSQSERVSVTIDMLSAKKLA